LLAAVGKVAGCGCDFGACCRDQLARDVIAIETFLGRVDVRLNVIARDMGHYQEVYRARILTLPHIADIEALMLIATIKDESALPL
jgi:Lrp/AsnC family transcriptional regulator